MNTGQHTFALVKEKNAVETDYDVVLTKEQLLLNKEKTLLDWIRSQEMQDSQRTMLETCIKEFRL